MLFNSIDFVFFLPIVFIIYWLIGRKNVKLQNAFLLVASYFFYGWWDARFLLLIAFSSIVDYFVSLAIDKAQEKRKRKLLLALSLLVNLGFLGFFKYYNFFAESFSDAFKLLGTSFELDRLHILLPVGISFYTFQTLSYTIDVYRKRIKPTKDSIAFFAFVSFFPQLVAGPIERASNLLPQFYKQRYFDKNKAKDGLRQILWGLFKKMVIADNCAIYANQIFNDSADYGGSTLFLGAVLFAFQIYGDFSGYSDIAIGTARLFGFNLMQNFAFPYFSRDIPEFWRRWHISLSTWFRDYVYIPLGGSRVGNLMKVRNVFIIFIVSGFWHGANWTFIIWGALNAIYFLPSLLLKTNRNNLDIVAQDKFFPSVYEIFKIASTFIMTTLAWVFFRAESVKQAIAIISNILSESLFQLPTVLPKGLLFLILVFISIEWVSRHKKHGLELMQEVSNIKKLMDFTLVSFLIWALLIWGSSKEVEFIYFQF